MSLEKYGKEQFYLCCDVCGRAAILGRTPQEAHASARQEGFRRRMRLHSCLTCRYYEWVCPECLEEASTP